MRAALIKRHIDEAVNREWPAMAHEHLTMKMRSLLIRQALSEQNGGSECAGLCGNRNLGLIEVIPGLQGDKTDKQAQDDAKRC